MSERFDLSGGELCLDLVNTLAGRDTDREEEGLPDYGRLVAWARQTGVVNAGEARRLLRESRRDPRHARRVLNRTIALREAAFRIFSTLVAGGRPAPADLETLNVVLSEGLGHRRIELGPDGPRWAWCADGARLERILWPVARSTAELLTSSELDRVRECAAETCRWLFLDHSRNASRRWCDMKVCGNRHKARRHYRRRRAAEGRPAT